MKGVLRTSQQNLFASESHKGTLAAGTLRPNSHLASKLGSLHSQALALDPHQFCAQVGIIRKESSLIIPSCLYYSKPPKPYSDF